VTTTDHWITTPGGRLFARSWTPPGRAAGTGPAIVLLHDSLGSVALWRDFPEKLASATGLAVTAYDRLGFGRSDPHPGHLPPGFIHGETTTGLLPLCEQLRLQGIIPFGHSVGGAMAVGAAAQLPARCLAVITEAAQAFVEDRTIAGIREAELAFRDPGQLARLAKYHGAKAPWVLQAWIGTWLSPGFAGWTLDEDLAGVACPLLALHGDRDEYGTVRHQERIASLPPGPSRSVLLPDCGHVPHRERPDEVLRETARFLSPLIPVAQRT